jgi:phage terminase large subunit GpA-like protein
VSRALGLVAAALGGVLAPPAPVSPSAWARENLIVPDGPKKLERWDDALTPYIAEPLDMTSVDAAENEFCVMKSAQTGFTTLLIAALGHTIDREPADSMVVQPTDGALGDFNSKKLQPAIDATKSLAAKVAPQTSRSGAGSTTYEKRFGYYTLTLALASSTADLRSKSVQKAFLDEVDEYEDDLDGQGSPFDMVEARQESFLKAGTWKRAYVSTPTVKGASHIEGYFERSDKRRWHVACPHCRAENGEKGEFVFEFGPNFVFERVFPYRAHYVAPCCGAIVEEYDRTAMVRTGRWIATDPAPGRMAGYHFDALSSPFVPWAKIAQRFVEAGNDPAKLKTFYNLTLGLPYEVRGDAPDHEKLMERREDGLRRGRVPPRGLLLVGAADVQMRGIWFAVWAYAPNRERWLVEADYLDGDTSSPEGEAFAKLKRRGLEERYGDAFGHDRALDALGVDSGYRSHVVYAWVRANQRPHPDTGRDLILALDGRDGWGLPAIGTPRLVDIDLDGRKVKQGAKLWPVGTWPLKGAFYADLRQPGVRSGQERDPDGYCHFGAWVDEVFFRQLTAEYLADETYRGRKRRVWKVRPSQPDNHFLDCAVYADALAEYLGLSTMTPADWSVLAERRGLPAEAREATLFTPRAPAEARAAQTEAPEGPKPTQTSHDQPTGWLGRPTDGWLRR